MPRAVFEKVPLLPGRSFASRHFRAPRFNAPWHFHPEYELTLILSGQGSRYVGDHIAPFAEGDLVLLGPDLPHFWWNDSTDRRRCEWIVLHFTADFAGHDFTRRPEAAIVRRLLLRAARGLHFSGAIVPRVAETMRTLAALAAWPRLLGFISLLGTLALARDTRSLASAGYAPILDASDGSRMAAACDYVNAQFTAKIRQPEAARRAGLSPAAFSRFFSRRMGKTFEGYVNEVRIGHACRLLLEGHRSVAEAAFASGFNNLANFNRRFRAITHRTPSAYRAAHHAAS